MSELGTNLKHKYNKYFNNLNTKQENFIKP